MCLRITWGVPPTVRRPQIAEVSKIADSYALDIWIETPIKPEDRPNGFPKDFYVGLTREYCDCSTALGSGKASSHREKSNDREIEKRRKKGWSQAKIDRWLSEAKNSTDTNSIQEDLLRWKAVISEIVSVPGVSRLALLIHQWDGKDPIDGDVEIPLDRLDEESLKNLQVATLYTFTKTKTR